MSKSVAVIGAGGHARSVIGVLIDCGFEVTGVFDESFKADQKEEILGVQLRGHIEDCPKNIAIVLAVGDNQKRQILAKSLKDQTYTDPIIHPTAVVHRTAKIGSGTMIFPMAFVNAQAKVGDNCIINSGCIIEHEASIGNHSHISIGSIVAGRVSIGSQCFLGAGAITIDQISIASNTIIGAGCVVHQAIQESGTYVGNPARKTS